MTPNYQHTAAQVIAAIKGSGAIKQAIADRLGVHRHTVDRYLERFPAALEAYQDEANRTDDYNETVINWQLHETRDITDGQGNTSKVPTEAAVDMAKWRASRKMRHRGYGDTVVVDIDPATLSFEQLERLHNGEDPMTVIGAGATPAPPTPAPKPASKPKRSKRNA